MSTTAIKKTKVIQTRLDADLVDQANEILDYIGLSATDVVRILFKNLVNTGELPFEFKKPKISGIPQNLPVLQLSETETAKIEQKLDDYYAGKLKTTKVNNSKELVEFLDALDK